MAETLYYSDKAVQITSTKARFGGREFDVANITSVSWSVNRADKTSRWQMFRDMYVGCAGLALLLFLTGLIFGSQLSDFGRNVTAYGAFASSMGASIFAYLHRERYIVTIEGTFGKADVVIAVHLRYARKVVKAVQAAVGARGI